MKEIHERAELLEVASQFQLGDFHEPDAVNITAEFAGTIFDNAGYWPNPGHFSETTEMHVILKYKGEPVAAVNLATLFAWATWETNSPDAVNDAERWNPQKEAWAAFKARKGAQLDPMRFLPTALRNAMIGAHIHTQKDLLKARLEGRLTGAEGIGEKALEVIDEFLDIPAEVLSEAEMKKNAESMTRVRGSVKSTYSRSWKSKSGVALKHSATWTRGVDPETY